MKSRVLILFVVWFASGASHLLFAQQTTTTELLNSNAVASEPLNTDDVTSVCDTIALGDSIVVVQTVCAPICSSRARIYNKGWQEIGILRPPFRSAFPEAYIEDGEILWRDNDNFDYTPAP